jgi:hypothetical protein
VRMACSGSASMVAALAVAVGASMAQARDAKVSLASCGSAAEGPRGLGRVGEGRLAGQHAIRE